VTEDVWKRGSMKFTSHPEERVWYSKKGETPSQFFARIIKYLEKDGANVWAHLRKEMEGLDEV